VKGSEKVTGVILAGGKSRRYGQNKALVQIQGSPLIQRVVGIMRSVFQDLLLITHQPEEYAFLDLPTTRDLIPGLGPIGGLYTALRVIPAQTAFLVACDMPFLNPRLIRYMVESRGDYDVVVPRIGSNYEALHALYRKTCLPVLEKFIKSGHYQMFRFYPHVRVRCVGEEEIRSLDPDLRSFFNVNRPSEIEALLQPQEMKVVDPP
jgi:molybdopterin-guanine dinucleotide biosynthesis protein A